MIGQVSYRLGTLCIFYVCTGYADSQIMAFVSLVVAFLLSISAVAYFAEEFPKYTQAKFSERDPRFDVSFGLQVRRALHTALNACAMTRTR